MTRLLLAIAIGALLLSADGSTQTLCESSCTAMAGQEVVVAADTLSGGMSYTLTMNGQAIPGAPPPTIQNGMIAYGLPLGLSPGFYTFQLLAYDPGHQVIAQWTNSLTVNALTDVIPPTVAVPTWTRSGKSMNVSIAATAADAESGLRSMAVFFEGRQLASCTASPCAATTKAKAGTIVVTAIDRAGNRSSNSAQVR